MHLIPADMSIYEMILTTLNTVFVFTVTAVMALFGFALILFSSLYEEQTTKSHNVYVRAILTGLLAGAVTLALTTLLAVALADFSKGYYEATGTITAVTPVETFAGQSASHHEITLRLDNTNDTVTIELPIEANHALLNTITPNAPFTLTTDTQLSPNTLADFIPIEELTYDERDASLIKDQFFAKPIEVDFIVDGETVSFQ